MPTHTTPLLIAIPGSCSLGDIKNVIRFHEAYFWKFKSAAVDGRLNKVTLVPFNGIPSDFSFAAESAKEPDATTEEWRGKLRYNGEELAVVVYRKSA